ncbi:hypothetical protein C0Q70_12496 [Pomacea canaliculata]|uniref:SID1 transmembrane family member 1 n=1 Tax=Pomacea canaliculata TaxID=400727 RepID=A0A2T7P1R7_POMCA|nr:hypothetical protein C0Q70_12496 [Pomacea canaliculata]
MFSRKIVNHHTTAIRVSSSSKEAQVTFPITFVVRRQQGIMSWQVPLYIDFVYEFKSMDRTLCPMDKTRRLNMTSHQNIFLEVATMSNTIVNFNLTATILSDFEFEPGVTKNVTASPTEPQYYMYTFPEDVEVVLLNVASDSELCAVISVQQIKCPVLDLDEDIGKLGKQYTMTTQAAMSVWKSDYYGHNAFYVVVLVKPNVADCSLLDVNPPAHHLSVATKNLSISITERSKNVAAIVFPFALFFSCDVVFGIFFCIFCMNFKCRTPSNIPAELTGERNCGLFFNKQKALAYLALGSGQPSSSPGMDPQASNTRNIEDIDGEGDSSDVAHLHVDEREADVTRNQTVEAPLDMFVSKKSDNEAPRVYLWILGTIALFYGLPAVQLVLTYSKKMNDTGDEDLCYYNFECAYPMRWGEYEIVSFNSIISNIGYIFLGILFLILVFLRNFQHIRHVLENPTCQNHNGMREHFGLLYAMGFALIVEGVMSACYHLCPTSSNYQFDTSFMYAITSLCILKIYEIRHPDAHLKAHRHYFCMGVYTCIAVLGMMNLSTQAINIKTAVIPVIAILVPVLRSAYISAVVGAIIRKPDFATYLLIILLVNLLLYFLLHIILKLSPEESRKENKPCVLLDFYDYHDVWHFLSAGAIFFSFMTTAIRVSTFSTEAQDDFPITFVVREQEDILSWMIPVSAGFDYKFPSMDRTLCPMDETKRLNLTSPQRVYVIVDTMSDTIRSFSLNATILPDFELVHGQDRELTASPSQPQYYMYTFPKDVDTVFLRVTSNSDLCAVISVQPIQCPVLDLDEDIGTLGKHQTMTTKATFFLEKSDYHRFQAFYVIVLVKPKLPRCSAPDDIPPQERLNVTTKNLSILITNTMSMSRRVGDNETNNWSFFAAQGAKTPHGRQKCLYYVISQALTSLEKREHHQNNTSRKQLRSSQHAGSQATSDSQLGSGQHSSSPGMDPQASTSNARNIEDIDGEGDTSDVAPLQDAGPDSDVTSNQVKILEM